MGKREADTMDQAQIDQMIMQACNSAFAQHGGASAGGYRPEADTPIPNMDKALEKSCIKLYKKAHRLRLPKYKALEQRARSEAQSMETKPECMRDGFAAWAMLYRAVEAQARQFASRDEAIFREWLEEDMRQFRSKLDVDQNGFLDKKEFTKWMTTQFRLPDKDVDKVMEMWDIDQTGKIGPYEYATLMAVWHNEKDLLDVEKEVNEVNAAIALVLPGCACGSLNCCLYGGYCSFSCCLCTACIAPCCYTCFCLYPAMKNMDSMEGMKGRRALEAAEQDLKDKVLQSVRKILLDGPSDSLKLQTKELQAPGAAHDHL